MVGWVKDKIMILFKANTTKYYNKPTRLNNFYGGGKKLRKPKTNVLPQFVINVVFYNNCLIF